MTNNKFIVIGLASIVLAIITGVIIMRVLVSPLPQQDEISLYVNSNYKLLENFPYHEIENFNTINPGYANNKKRDENKNKVITEYLGDKTIVQSVYAYSEDILQFYCGGKGMLRHSTYIGFYFSKEDVPYAFEFGDVALTEIALGVFEWQDDRHKIHTEKIRDNWYYYLLEWK